MGGCTPAASPGSANDDNELLKENFHCMPQKYICVITYNKPLRFLFNPSFNSLYRQWIMIKVKVRVLSTHELHLAIL